MSKMSKDFEITVSTACGDKRTFNNVSKAEYWVKIHKKRCACCEKAELVNGHRKYTGDIKKKNDEERIQREKDIQHTNTRSLGETWASL